MLSRSEASVTQCVSGWIWQLASSRDLPSPPVPSPAPFLPPADLPASVPLQMTRGGKFQIAFDHDKSGKSSEAGDGPAEGEDIKWIHEQRLEINARQYFCGKGSSPPQGIDRIRPKGSWYLHETATVPA